MNNDTRKQIDAIIKDIEKSENTKLELKTLAENFNEKLAEYKKIFSNIENKIENLRDKEQDKLDNFSEGLQDSEREQNIKAACKALDYAIDNCDGAYYLEEITIRFEANDVISSLNDAKVY